MPVCSKCGAELDEAAKFCMECGTPVSQNKKYMSYYDCSLTLFPAILNLFQKKKWIQNVNICNNI